MVSVTTLKSHNVLLRQHALSEERKGRGKRSVCVIDEIWSTWSMI